MRHTSLVAVFLSLLCVVSSCRTASTEPTDLYQGNWSGTITDRVAGAGTMQLLIPGPGVAGSYSLAFASGTSLNGTTADYRFLSGQLNVPFACPPANGVFVVKLDGDRLKGTFNAAGCSVLTDGTVDLGR